MFVRRVKKILKIFVYAKNVPIAKKSYDLAVI